MTEHERERDRVDDAEERAHRGTFAEGQAEEEPHPERGPKGDFARGQERPETERADERAHRGTFAEGQAEEEPHPEEEREGDFGRGLEREG
jgi:hypothetical protein